MVKHSQIAFLRERPRAPLAHPSALPERPLDLAVPYTNPALTAHTLAEAVKLAQGCQAAVTLIAVHVLPYPAPLECQEGIRQRREAELAAVVRTCPATVRVKLVFARDRDYTYLALLPKDSLVVMGVKHRWWRTRDERLARKLAADGRTVAIVRMK